MDQYKDCLNYIENYWNKIIKKSPKDDFRKRKIFLPKSFVVPNTNLFSLMFYWDSYFMAQGLIATDKEYLVKNILENFTYLFKRFAIIPNIASFDYLSRSQPPFFSSLAWELFESNKDKKMLKKYMDAAQEEYKIVWTKFAKAGIGNYHHRVADFLLSRYGDRDAGYNLTSELESGWDLTSRFNNRCSHFLPIDLNAYLYKYETDFIESAKILKNKKEQKKWEKKREERLKEFQGLLWNEEIGFYFDFDYIAKKQNNFYSLAGFVPLWAGIATNEQAEKIVKHLPKFETNYGLTISDKESLRGTLEPQQWDYPSIWPPLEYLTVMGLIKYGYTKDAKRIIKKSLDTWHNIYKKYGVLFEKMSGETGDIADSFHYENQSGFGWTNAIFYKYTKLLEKL